MKFAKIVFWVAGIWGVLILTPLYFMFDLIGRQTPPPINHPQFYFGFLGAGLVWQIAFFVIAKDPVRFRPMMIPSVLEKLSYVVMLIMLHLQGRLDAGQMFFCGTDLLLGLLFIAAFVKTSRQEQAV